MSSPHALEDGSLFIRARLTIPAEEIVLRVTTSGGPGGQHANRSLTRVVASFDARTSTVLSSADRAMLIEHLGPVVRASAGRFRSQGQNRGAALEQLAEKIAVGARRDRRRVARPSRPRARRSVASTTRRRAVA